jgi:hypothetical protein
MLFFAACIPAFYIASEGYERFIRLTQHTIESAVRDYEGYASSSLVFASIDAREELSGGRLTGRFRIVGALNPHTLVFEGPDGRLHTAGREFESDFVADNIICMKGAPARATVRRIEMGGRFLGGLLEPGDSAGESFFFGEVAAAEDLVVPARLRCFSPVTGSGKRVRLNFARWSDLKELNLEQVLVSAGTVIVKTVTDTSAPGAIRRGQAPGPGGTLLAYSVGPGETIEIRKRRGDTVGTGEILALRVAPTVFDEQRALNERQRESARARDRASVLELDRAIAE